MTQNIYDKEEFFKGYSQLNRSVHGLDGAPEWSSIKALLPDLSGKRIVDLGCGFGWFARYAMSQGAASVLGIDISKNMIDKAITDTSNDAITYEIANLDNLELPEASFEFAYSSLAFHYIENFKKLMVTIHRALVPDSDLVFTIEHPIYMAPTNPKLTTDTEGHRIWPLDRYFVEGRRVTDWLAKGVAKQHRTMSTTLNTLIDTGFTIRHVEEWVPTVQQLQEHPDWAEELDRPMFLLISAHRG